MLDHHVLGFVFGRPRPDGGTRPMRIAGCGSAAPSVSTTCACSHGKRYKWHSDSAYRPGPLLLAAVRRALIGETQARGFQEAAAKWHRYADDRGDARRATKGQ